jgi:hypothetical protein
MCLRKRKGGQGTGGACKNVNTRRRTARCSRRGRSYLGRSRSHHARFRAGNAQWHNFNNWRWWTHAGRWARVLDAPVRSRHRRGGTVPPGWQSEAHSGTNSRIYLFQLDLYRLAVTARRCRHNDEITAIAFLCWSCHEMPQGAQSIHDGAARRVGGKPDQGHQLAVGF